VVALEVYPTAADGSPDETRAHSFQAQPLSFTYLDDELVTGVRPKLVAVGASPTLFVSGQHFLDDPSLTCQFRAHEPPFALLGHSPATFDSPSTLRCSALRLHQASTVDVEVVLRDTVNASSPALGQRVSVQYFLGVSVTAVEPPAGSAGTRLVVGLAAASAPSRLAQWFCRFGTDAHAPATLLTEPGPAFACTVPEFPHEGVDVLPVGLVVYDPTSQEYQEASTNNAPFRLTAAPTLWKATPAAAFVHGGAHISLHGANFAAATLREYDCVFGHRYVGAILTVESSEHLVCQAPAVPSAMRTQVCARSPRHHATGRRARPVVGDAREEAARAVRDPRVQRPRF
jgi:hypothetical protein